MKEEVKERQFKGKFRWRHRRAGFGRPERLCILADILTPWNLLMVAHLIAFATSHYLLVGGFVVLLVLLIIHEMSRGGRSLSTRELTALVNSEQGLVIDIRPAKDYAAGHIVGALNIPQDKLMARIGELEKHKAKTLILVDAMGQHAGTHARELLKAGFTAAKLGGGISSWRADNLPLVK